MSRYQLPSKARLIYAAIEDEVVSVGGKITRFRHGRHFKVWFEALGVQASLGFSCTPRSAECQAVQVRQIVRKKLRGVQPRIRGDKAQG